MILTLLFWAALAALFIFIFPAGPVYLFWIAIAAWLVAWWFVYRRKKQKFWFITALLSFLVLVWFTLHIPGVQTWLVKKVAGQLSAKLKTRVEVKHVDFSFFDKMNIQGVYAEDLRHDTLLYAGELNVRITDWFFLRDKATLHYVQLNDATFYLNRTDSVWNYQFFLDFFSSPEKKTDSTKSGIDLDLKKVEMNNLHFVQSDKWTGKDLVGFIKKLNLDAEQFDFSNKNIIINSLDLDQPFFYENRFTGNKPVALPNSNHVIEDTATTIVDPGLQWNTAGWVVDVKRFHVTNGMFNNDKQTERQPYTDRFDGQHLRFTEINGDLNNIHFEKDTVLFGMQFSAKEKSGLNLKQLKANMKFTPAKMEFNDLDLQVNNSHLSNYYSMGYGQFPDDMGDFMHSIFLQGNFTRSIVHTDDLAIFAPSLKSWKRVFEINGSASGTIDNLSLKKMNIKSGATIIDGDMVMRGLPNIKETFIDFTGNDVLTNYNDLVTFIPALRNAKGIQLNRLGNIHYKGNFTGFINDFVTFGTFNTALGTITGDLNMKLPEGRPAQYSGKISTGGFNLGQFINNPNLGNIAANGKITGSGFSEKDLHANFEGTFNEIYFSGNTYHNISLNAGFQNKEFSGTGSINDPDLMIDDFNGSINFNNAQPMFNFDATVSGADLKKLHLTNDSFRLAGRFNLNFTGADIDHFVGKARVYSASLLHNGKALSFDSLTLSSMFLPDNKKQLVLHSNEADATITGNFKILELPDAFTYFLNKYYPAYIEKPTRALSKQDFEFLIQTRNVEEYIRAVDPRLSGFNNSTVSGSLNLGSNEMTLAVDVKEFRFEDKVFKGIDLKARGNTDSLYTNLQTGDIAIGDSLHFPGAQMEFASHNNLTRVAIRTSASKTLSEARLFADVTSYKDGVGIHFSPSSFIINDKKWELEKDGELTIRNSVINASEVKFVQGEQSITISTEPDELLKKTNVVVELQKISLNDFVPLLVSNPRMEGSLSGTLRISDPFSKKPTFSFDNGKAEHFVMNDKLYGDVNIRDVNYGKDKMLSFKIDADNEKAKFSADARINLGDTLSEKMLDIAFQSEHLDLEALEPYLGTVFSNIKGNAVSDLKVSGSSKHQYLTGTVAITNGSFKVNYTQCKYLFSNETILFNPDEIDFGNMILRDTMNNEATLTGRLFHSLFKDFRFDNIHLQTGRMLLMNTTKKDNSSFYGKIVGNATMNMDGPISNLQMDIQGGPSTLISDKNHIYLPTSSSRDQGAIDYIDFVQFGSVMENELSTKEGTNIVLDMVLDANPACQVDVILDENTGDIIKGQGNGRLNITVGNKEPLAIRGTYVIESGSYNFNFQQFFDRGFTLRKGGYISWNKPDPYDADIHIDAEYLATKVDFSTLGLQNTKAKSNVRVIAHLTNTLKAPNVNFEFELPPESVYAQNLFVKSKLTDYASDNNEIAKQVTSVLIFNSFLSQNQSFFEGRDPYSIGINTIGQILSRNLTGWLNHYLEQKGFTLNLDVSSSSDIATPNFNQFQAAGTVSLSKKIFKGRVILTAGGNVDINNPYLAALRNSNSSVLITPDITAEFLLTPDGKFRVVAFTRTNTDFNIGQKKRGVSFTYRKDF